jgi:Aspartyl/Asparaginyl beta-hydroxylase
MECKTITSLPPAIKAIRQMLANSIWLESMTPVYHFVVDEVDWGWTPKEGFRFGKPEAATCVVHVNSLTLAELLQGRCDPRALQQQGLIRLGGLFSDAIALSKIFLPEEQQLSRWRNLFGEASFSLKNWSTEGRRLQVESLLPVLDRIEEKHTWDLGRVRNVLNSWVEHKIANCRLNQWVRFDFEGLEVKPWEDPSRLDEIVRPSFGKMRQEVMAFLDRSVLAPHYGGSDADPDTPSADRPSGWRSYNFIEHFEWKPNRAERFPETRSVIEEISRSHTIVHAGFLIMEPGVYLPPHCDGANWLLSYQFGLVVPEKCHLQVDDEKRLHKEGCGLVFNDSFVHSAANESGESRILLAVLYANPHLSDMEQEAMVEVASRLQKGFVAYAN